MFILFCVYLTATSNLIHKASPCPSPSAPPTSKANLPVWASWLWGHKYLPGEIHAKKDGFHAALSAFRRYSFVDHNKGTPVVLGLGLLLRECWRAVEVEADDSNSPNFLRKSVLGVEMAEEVVSIMKEVSARVVTVAAETDRVESVESVHGEELRQREQEGESKGESKERMKVSEEKKMVEEQEEEIRARSKAEEAQVSKNKKNESEKEKEKEKEGREEEKPKRRGRKHRAPVQTQ
jgi:hypothetical protein